MQLCIVNKMLKTPNQNVYNYYRYSLSSGVLNGKFGLLRN